MRYKFNYIRHGKRATAYVLAEDSVEAEKQFKALYPGAVIILAVTA